MLALVLAEALKHQRHIPVCGDPVPVLVAGACAVRAGTCAWPAARRVTWPDFASDRPLCDGLPGSRLLRYWPIEWGRDLSGVPVSNYEYPVDALQFMADQGLTGRLVVAGHWAQYALGVMGAYAPEDPGVSVAFDGRFRTCYPQQVVDMHFDFFVGDGGPDKRYRSPLSPPADPKRVLEYDDPQLVLLNRHEPHPVAVMQSVQDQWVLLYQDQLAQLWGRRSIYDQPGQASYFPPPRRQLAVGPPDQSGSLAGRAPPS